MLDEFRTPQMSDRALENDYRVRESAQRLFERLNPPVRDHRIPTSAPLLTIYDWEIATDTGIEIEAVRSALRLIDGAVVVLEVVNREHQVVALAGASAQRQPEAGDDAADADLFGRDETTSEHLDEAVENAPALAPPPGLLTAS